MSRHVVSYNDFNTYKMLDFILFDSYEDAVANLEENGYRMKNWEDYFENIEEEKYAVIEKCVVNKRYSTNISKDSPDCFAVYVKEDDEESDEDFLRAYISDEKGIKELVEKWNKEEVGTHIYRFERLNTQ